MKSLEGRNAARGHLGLSLRGKPAGGVRAVSAQSKTEEQVRVQTKDPRRRGLQGRNHRAEFWVNRTQDLLPPRRIPAPPKRVTKNISSLLLVQRIKQNLKCKETRRNEGERQEKRRGKCSLNG